MIKKKNVYDLCFAPSFKAMIKKKNVNDLCFAPSLRAVITESANNPALAVKSEIKGKSQRDRNCTIAKLKHGAKKEIKIIRN